MSAPKSPSWQCGCDPTTDFGTMLTQAASERPARRSPLWPLIKFSDFAPSSRVRARAVRHSTPCQSWASSSGPFGSVPAPSAGARATWRLGGHGLHGPANLDILHQGWGAALLRLPGAGMRTSLPAPAVQPLLGRTTLLVPQLLPARVSEPVGDAPRLAPAPGQQAQAGKHTAAPPLGRAAPHILDQSLNDSWACLPDRLGGP